MGTFVGKAGMPAATASGGAGKAAKRKGPQTTPPGTKNTTAFVVGFTRADGTWSGRTRRRRDETPTSIRG